MTSKTIIISSPQGNSERGILTLFQEEDLLKCRLRTYNLAPISRYCKIGIYHCNEVYSANLIEKNGVYESSFVGNFKIEEDFYVALIDTEENNNVLLAGGTYQGCYFNDNSVFLETQKLDNDIKEKKETINQNEVDCGEDCDKCAKCKYKEYFYSQQNINDLDVEQNLSAKSNENQQEIRIKKVTASILPQIESLFQEYEQDEQLNKLISNAKFVKINENGERYSIGAIYEDDTIKYICYAIKRDYNITPPKELGENYQWLPLDPEDPLSVGYYVVFQDAKDLKIVKI